MCSSTCRTAFRFLLAALAPQAHGVSRSPRAHRPVGQHFPPRSLRSAGCWRAVRCRSPTSRRRTSPCLPARPARSRDSGSRRPRSHGRAEWCRRDRAHGSAQRGPLFLALGRLVPHKRIDLLLRLWDEVRPFTGAGSSSSATGRTWPAPAPRWRRRGVPRRRAQEEKLELLSSAWMLVHVPPRTRAGAWSCPRSRHGAHADHAFDVPGLRDTVRHGITGHLAQDDREFVDAWVRYAQDAARRERLGLAARQWAEGFTWDRTVDRLEGLLLDLVQGPAAQALLPPRPRHERRAWAPRRVARRARVLGVVARRRRRGVHPAGRAGTRRCSGRARGSLGGDRHLVRHRRRARSDPAARDGRRRPAGGRPGLPRRLVLGSTLALSFAAPPARGCPRRPRGRRPAPRPAVRGSLRGERAARSRNRSW